MSLFSGRHTTKLDAKGRTSVPSAFRAVLRGEPGGAATLFLRESHKWPCIEGWSRAGFELLAKPLQALDLFSDDSDDLTLALYGDTYEMEPDKDGRIVVPESLARHAGLDETIVFMGMGSRFEIWEPAAAAKRLEEARERARVKKLVLPGAAGAGA